MKPETKRAFDYLKDHWNPLDDLDINRTTYIMMLFDYIDNKGEDALQALAGFYIWAKKNLKGDKQENAVRSTFAHDLGQQKDEWMLPRSTDYLEFWKNRNKTSPVLPE